VSIIEREFEVWCEGYRATVDRADATLLGRVVAADFDGAVRAVRDSMDDARSRACFEQQGVGRWTFWACRLWDNELDARESYG